MIERKLMPLAESVMRRSELRDKGHAQVSNEYRPSTKDFDLSGAFYVARQVPHEQESAFRHAKLQGDRMIHAMLDAHVSHRLHRMVLKATSGYDNSVKELVTDEDTERFILHLVNRKAVLVSEEMLGAFSMLLREEHLKYPPGTKELAGYIVQRFNEEQPLTKSVVAIEESGKVVVMFVG